jgi:hypothetical protein
MEKAREREQGRGGEDKGRSIEHRVGRFALLRFLRQDSVSGWRAQEDEIHVPPRGVCLPICTGTAATRVVLLTRACESKKAATNFFFFLPWFCFCAHVNVRFASACIIILLTLICVFPPLCFSCVLCLVYYGDRVDVGNTIKKQQQTKTRRGQDTHTHTIFART